MIKFTTNLIENSQKIRRKWTGTKIDIFTKSADKDTTKCMKIVPEMAMEVMMIEEIRILTSP